MAEDEEAAKEEAKTLPKEQEAKPGRRERKVEPPVSLYPLTFEEAVEDLLKVQIAPEGGDRPKKATT